MTNQEYAMFGLETRDRQAAEAQAEERAEQRGERGRVTVDQHLRIVKGDGRRQLPEWEKELRQLASHAVDAKVELDIQAEEAAQYRQTYNGARDRMAELVAKHMDPDKKNPLFKRFRVAFADGFGLGISVKETPSDGLDESALIDALPPDVVDRFRTEIDRGALVAWALAERPELYNEHCDPKTLQSITLRVTRPKGS